MKLDQWFLGAFCHPSRWPAVNLFNLLILFDYTLDASPNTSVLLPLATHPVVSMENKIVLGWD